MERISVIGGRWLIAALAVGVAALVAGSSTAATPQLASDMPSRIDGFVEEQMDARQVPGFALAIVRGTEVVHQRGFGSADGTGRPVTVDTPFVLGSTTKSFTALAVMQLIDAGKVSLDAPVARYIPELRLADGAERRITVRHLLNQTSGIPGLAGGRLLRSVGDGTMEEVVGELEGTKLLTGPGAEFQYANANYVLLGLVIERGSGERYGDYVQRHIFGPLGMRHSFASPDAAKASGLAVGHRYWFGFPFEHGPTSPEANRSAGYLMSSAADMSRYLAMYLNGGVVDGRRIISREGLATMLRPEGSGALGGWADHHSTRYGMGWFVGGPWQEPALLHPGGSPDSSSMIVLLPRQRLAVVTLANANNELPLPGGDGSLDRIPRGVVSLLVGEEPSTGTTLSRFYLIFDTAVALILVAVVWSLARLGRRQRQIVHGWRLGARLFRAAAEAGVGLLLLAAPVLVGQSWAGALLWWPDFAVVLLLIGSLLIVIGGVRAAMQIVARRGAAPVYVTHPISISANAGGLDIRTHGSPPTLRLRAAEKTKGSRAGVKGVETDASAEDS